MDNLKIGDIISFSGNKEEVRGIAGNVIFTRKVFEKGFGQTTLLGDIEDLVTFGWKLLIKSYE